MSLDELRTELLRGSVVVHAVISIKLVTEQNTALLIIFMNSFLLVDWTFSLRLSTDEICAVTNLTCVRLRTDSMYCRYQAECLINND